MAKKKTNEVAKNQKCDLAKLDYGDDAGCGFEGTTNDDFSIPFLSMFQGLSPQVAGENPLDGAKVGMLFNTVTEEMWDGKEGLIFVPSCRDHCYMEWVPRSQGGGYVGRHELGSEVVVTAKRESTDRKLKSPSGNDLVETFYMYGVIVMGEDVDPSPVVISFTSTKIRAYRTMMTKLNQVTVGPRDKKKKPPLFAHQIRITTVMEKNNKGTYANFRFDPAFGTILESLLDPSSPVFTIAKGLSDMVQEGQAKINYDSADSAGSDEEKEEPPF